MGTTSTLALRPRSVLAITDLSAAGTNAAWRAALVARDRGVPLHLLNLQARPAAVPEALAALQELARELRERLHIATSAQAMAGELQREGAQAAGDADLLVIAAGRGNLLGDWILGTRAERLLRRCRTPVLVVRRPAFTSYRSVVVTVELRAEAGSLIAAARALSRDPRMKVLHVLGTAHEEVMRLADVPEKVIHAQRREAAEHARRALADLIAATGAHEDGAVPVVSFGHAPTSVLEDALARAAELLVLGKRPRPALADLLVGGVAQRVLSATRADVLVVPLPQSARLAAAPAAVPPALRAQLP